MTVKKMKKIKIHFMMISRNFSFFTLLEARFDNCMILLSLIFYVKLILENAEVQKLPFYAILWAMNFVNLVNFSL